MNLLFSINKNCTDLLLNCMWSIAENGGAECYTAYILHSDLQWTQQKTIRSSVPSNMRCDFICVPEDLFDGFPETKRYPQQIYYRLAAAQLLPPDTDRVLYLDVDTVVINSLVELYRTDFEGNMFVACTHTKKFLSFVNQLRLDVDDDVSYINTGVLLMNLPVMREELHLEDIQNYALDKRNVLILPDQDILTALYGHRVKIADTLKYNISDRDIEFHNLNPANCRIDADWVRQNTSIIHYYGRNKPWRPHYRGVLDVFYKEQKIITHSKTPKADSFGENTSQGGDTDV